MGYIQQLLYLKGYSYTMIITREVNSFEVNWKRLSRSYQNGLIRMSYHRMKIPSDWLRITLTIRTRIVR